MVKLISNVDRLGWIFITIFIANFGSSAIAANDYPYANSCTSFTPSCVDPWGFYYRECTSYVAWRMNRDAGTTSPPYAFYNTMQDPNYVHEPNRWSNAGHWANHASDLGIEVNHTPAVGAIAHWGYNEIGGGYGHVAYVEAVNSDGSVYVSEYNISYKSYGTRNNQWAPRYIHFNDNGGSNGKPDLRVSELNVSTSNTGATNNLEVLRGDELNIDVWISNKGDADVNDKFHIKYLVSNDRSFTKHDASIASDDISSIVEGDRNHESTTIKIDQVGTYYIGAWADYKNEIDEEDESNNFSDSDDEIATITVVRPNSQPIGNLDSATCATIRGWAEDPDSPNSPIQVHLYLDGKSGAGGQWLASITADEERRDVGYHSFSFITPEILKDGSYHTLYLYGIDTEGGVNPLLASSGIICVPDPCFGYPVYRFCNLSTGTYIYTISETEKNSLANQNDVWRYEGYPWYCSKKQDPGTLPVYRFCNLQTGGYLYTLSASEINTVSSLPNWRAEGIQWYSYPNEEPFTLPVYRFANLNSGVYLYTKNESEKTTLMSNPDWRYEGISWYISTCNRNNATVVEDKGITEVQIIPVASFSADTVAGRPPLKVQFNDTSTGNLIGWEWDFGDGDTSNEQNPFHTFLEEGSYTVKLTVFGEEAEQHLEKINYIEVEKPYQLSDVIVGLQILTGEYPFYISAYENEKVTMNKILQILSVIANLR